MQINKLTNAFESVKAGQELIKNGLQIIETESAESAMRGIPMLQDKIEHAQAARRQFNAELADILTQAEILTHNEQKRAAARVGHVKEMAVFARGEIDLANNMLTLLQRPNFKHVLHGNPRFVGELFAIVADDAELSTQAVTHLSTEQFETLRRAMVHDGKRREILEGNDNDNDIATDD